MPKRVTKLTPRQLEVFNFIGFFTGENGFPPTMKEIADSFGFTAPAAYDKLRALERKGYIERKPQVSRSIKILK